MIDKTVILDGILFCLYHLDRPYEDLAGYLACLPAGAYAVICYPSEGVDFAIECYDSDREPMSEPYLPLSVVLDSQKHCEDKGVELTYFGKHYSVNTPWYMPNFSANTDKCKQLFSNIEILPSGTIVKTYFFIGEFSCRIFICDDARRVSRELLASLRIHNGRALDVALAVSFSEEARICHIGRMRPLEATSLALAALIYDGRLPADTELSVFTDIGRHRVRITDGDIEFIPRIQTFENPACISKK